MNIERMTVTIPGDLVREIDRRERNRSKFVVEAVRREVERRRREELALSLRNPHAESAEVAEQGLEDWARGMPEEDLAGMVEWSGGSPVRWVAGVGWVEGEE